MSASGDSAQSDGDDQGDEVVQYSPHASRDVFETFYSKGKVYVFPDVVKPSLSDKEVFPQTQLQEDDDTVVYKVNTEKLKKGTDNLKGDDSEWRTLKLIKEAIEKLAEPRDPPAFILHSQHLDDDKESETGKAKRSEKDAIVLHRRLGIVVVEVKAVDNPKSRSRFAKAAKQVLKAKECLLQQLKDWVREDAVSMVIVLPNLKPENASDVRRMCKDIRDHPEMEILCGQDGSDYGRLLQNLLQKNSTADPFCPAFAGTGSADYGDNNYKAVVTSYCSVPRYGEAVKECAQSMKRWLLTEEQMQISSAREDFVHIYGSPGTGKTLLLLHRARRWLKKGRCVALVIGRSFRDTLLAQLGREVSGARIRDANKRLFVCRNPWELWDEARALGKTGGKLCVIIDELGGDCLELLCGAIALLKQEKLIKSAWSADLVDNPHEWYEEAEKHDLHVRRFKLSDSLRYSDDVMNTLNRTSLHPYEPVVERQPVPLPRTFATETEIIVHPDHHNEQGLDVPYKECSTCRTKLQDIFRTLGLVDPVYQNQLDWPDCIILHTGRYITDDKLPTLVQWLNDLKIPAEYDTSMFWTSRFTSVMVPHSRLSHSAAEVETKKETDEKVEVEKKEKSANAEMHEKEENIQAEEEIEKEEMAEKTEIANSDDIGLENLFVSEDEVENVTGDQRDSHVVEVNAWRERVLTGKSKERKQREVVHVMDVGDFIGLERPVVIMVHMDDRDIDPEQQSEFLRRERCKQHKRWWYHAISRCQGKLIVLALTPSPGLQVLRPI